MFHNNYYCNFGLGLLCLLFIDKDPMLLSVLPPNTYMAAKDTFQEISDDCSVYKYVIHNK